jgi:hypothetical protein
MGGVVDQARLDGPFANARLLGFYRRPQYPAPKMLTRAPDKGRASGLSQAIPQRPKMMDAGATESAKRNGLAKGGG